MVLQAVVALAQGTAYRAFPGMVPAAVQRGTAQRAVGTAVLAEGTLRAHREQQPVTQSHLEVRPRHGRDALLRREEEVT